MAKPMTTKQKSRWIVMRARGWAWHVFIRGPFRYGFIWGAGMLLLGYFHLFGGEWHGFARELPVLAVVAALVGISVAWFEWRREESRFMDVNTVVTLSV